MKFKDEWLAEESFQGWLVKVSNDESRAYCRFCAIVLRAHKADLSGHGSTQKHASNAKIAEEAGNNHAPISVQIVCNENEDIDNNDNEPHMPDEIQNQLESGETDLKPAMKRFFNKTKDGTSKSPYKKKYRSEWENEQDLKDWLQPYPLDSTKAYCKACGVVLRAHKHDLICHARSKRHATRLENGETTDLITFENSRPSKIPKVGSSSEDGMEDGIVSVLGIDNNDDEDNDPMTERSPVLPRKPVIRTPKESPKPYSRRRTVKINDVFTAIENDEFTGYELLQMVKRIVQKL